MSRNKFASLLGVISSLVGIFSLFYVFRNSVEYIGLSLVGLWSLIQGIFIISRIADSGAATNTTRRVALDKSSVRSLGVNAYAIAGTIQAGIPAILLSLLIFYPTYYYLKLRYGSGYDDEYLITLIFLAAIVSVVGSVSSVLLGAIEGCGGLVSKNSIMTMSHLTTAIASPYIMQSMGDYGLAISMMVGIVVQFALALFVLSRIQRSCDTNWRGAREAFYGTRWESVNFSLMGLTRVSFEPFSKFAFSIFGSLTDLAAFDLALKVSAAARLIFQSAVQPLLLIAARGSGSISTKVHQRLERANFSIIRGSLVLCMVQIGLAPVVSLLGMRQINQMFMNIYILLAISGAVNSFGLVGYYCQVSSGDLRPLVAVQVKMLIINIFACLLLGFVIGGYGIVIAYSISFLYGGLVLMKIFGKTSKISRPFVLLSPHIWPFFGVAFSLIMYFTVTDSANLIRDSLIAVTAYSVYGALCLRAVLLLYVKEGARL